MKGVSYQYITIPTGDEVPWTRSPLLYRYPAERQQKVVPDEWKHVAISFGIIACGMVLAAVFLGIYAIRHNNGEDHHQ
jgi:ABC-type proline/glycine betaine transport system permease subunit|eukprot:scaffold2688_cov292-Chaetoceros_neogracile.AAC.5